jgi:hypothetical protein
MSLIHLEKSVLTFHLKEILEDGHGNHPLTWLSLALLIVGPKLFPSGANVSQPVAKTRTKSRGDAPMSLSQWVAEARKRELASQKSKLIDPASAPLPSEKGHHHQQSERVLTRQR